VAVGSWPGHLPTFPLYPQLGVKALTYNDLIQAQKEISAHNQQLREQSEQLERDNRELRSQSLQLVR
jgi:H3 lysine-79-specific histone-lysine N-methyltransferase